MTCPFQHSAAGSGGGGAEPVTDPDRLSENPVDSDEEVDDLFGVNISDEDDGDGNDDDDIADTTTSTSGINDVD